MKSKYSSNTYGATLYGGVQSWNGYYLKGSFFGGHQRAKFKDAGAYDENGRQVAALIGYLGRDKRTNFGASAEVGKTFQVGLDSSIKPHIGLDYSYSPKESYSGTFTWDFADDVHHLEIPVGLLMDHTFASSGCWSIKAMADASFVGSVGRTDTWHTGVSSRTGDEWKVYGVGGGHYGARIKAGIEAIQNKRLSVGVEYTFEARKRYTDN